MKTALVQTFGVYACVWLVHVVCGERPRHCPFADPQGTYPYFKLVDTSKAESLQSLSLDHERLLVSCAHFDVEIGDTCPRRFSTNDLDRGMSRSLAKMAPKSLYSSLHFSMGMGGTLQKEHFPRSRQNSAIKK